MRTLQKVLSRRTIAIGVLCIVILLIAIHSAFPVLVEALGQSYFTTILGAFALLPLAFISVLLSRESNLINLPPQKLLLLITIAILCVAYLLIRLISEYNEPLELLARAPIYWLGGFTAYPSYAIDLVSFTHGPDRLLCIPIAIVNLLFFTAIEVASLFF